MTTHVVPTRFLVDRARDLSSRLESGKVYLFFGDPTQNSTPDDLLDTTRDAYADPWNEMVAGSLVTEVSPVISRITYSTGKVYPRYDDLDSSQESHACVDTGSYTHVYRCLDNAQNSVSTVAPDFSQVGVSPTLETSDGYVWKYLFSVSSQDVQTYATGTLLPVSANAQVANSAVPGAIDVVVVETGGSGYLNYLSGTLLSQDVRVGGDTTLYQVSNSSLSTTDSFYEGCVMTIVSGTGIGQSRRISESYSNASGNYLRVEEAFDVPPQNGSGYEVYPGIDVTGSDGSETPLLARAIVNASGNTIQRVEVLDRGSGLRRGDASVHAESVVGISDPASVRIVFPPPGGHGSDPGKELGATRVIASGTLSNSLPSTGGYRRIGLLEAPRFQGVTLGLTGRIGNFAQDESVLIGSIALLGQNCSTNSATAAVDTDSRGVFRLATNGDVLVLETSTGMTALPEVSSVQNNTSLTLISNSLVDSSGANLYLLTIESESRVSLVSDSITVTNTLPVSVGSVVLGESSGASATISTVSQDFSGFVQLHKYSVQMTGSEFVAGETVSQGDASATVHTATSSEVWVWNQVGGEFVVGGQSLTGLTSGSTGSVLSSTEPELVWGSGQVVQTESIQWVERDPSQTENFRVVFRCG